MNDALLKTEILDAQASIQLGMGTEVIAQAVLEGEWLKEQIKDARSRMKLEIISAVHGIPSYGTSPADNHFDLPGEADKTVVMDVIREVEA